MSARVDQSMSLITELMEHPLEPSYEVAAAQRRDAGLKPATSTATPLVLVTALVVGLLFALAAVNLRAASSVVGQTRIRLIEQIEAGQARGDDLKGKVAAIDGQIIAAQQAALGPSGLLQRLDELQVATGARAVSGPGVRVTLDDAADLQIIVNGLWAAGAEAIDVNGQRLTTRAAIRFAGQAILVDFRPLTRPYLITAIGDARQMAATFSASPAGSYLKALGDNYGIPTSVKTEAAVTCPAGTIPAMAYALSLPATPSTTSPTAKPTSTRAVGNPTPTTTRTTSSPTKKATTTPTETPR